MPKSKFYNQFKGLIILIKKKALIGKGFMNSFENKFINFYDKI